MKKLLLIGGGGHCTSVADAVLQTNEYDDIGIVDNKDEPPLFGIIPVIGTDDDLPRLHSDGWKFAFVTVGSIGDVTVRRRLYKMLLEYNFETPSIIDPSAEVSEHASLGQGIFVGKNAVINAGSVIGNCSIVNTGAVVEHDCMLGSFVHIATGATLCGGVKIGENTHIGAGSVIKQYLTIGNDALIGMGSVVINDIGNYMKVAGNPVRPLGNDR